MDTDAGGGGSEAQRTTLLLGTPPSQPALVVPCNLLVLVVTEYQHPTLSSLTWHLQLVFYLFLYAISLVCQSISNLRDLNKYELSKNLDNDSHLFYNVVSLT